MFCPKCGTQNPDNGKFCRNCGTDLGNVSNALTGNSKYKSQKIELRDRKGKPVHWEGAIGKIFSGLAFLAVAIVLGVTGAAGGRAWWFWMLIPALTALGSGVAQIIQLKKSEKTGVSLNPVETQNSFPSNYQNSALPPNQTEYVAPDSRYKTGDLVPPSVVEDTTRHLEFDKESETMTLPQQQKK